MKRISDRLAGLTVAVVFATIAILAAIYCQAKRRMEISRNGRFTAEQILEWAKPSLHQLYAGVDQLEVFTLPEHVCTLDGAPHNIWLIECSDNEGRHLGTEHWDSNTGRLIAFTRCYSDAIYSPPPAKSGPPISRREGARIARAWLASLNLASRADEWRLEREPNYHDATWRGSWRTKDWWAGVTLDTRSGRLMSVDCMLAMTRRSPEEIPMRHFSTLWMSALCSPQKAL